MFSFFLKEHLSLCKRPLRKTSDQWWLLLFLLVWIFCLRHAGHPHGAHISLSSKHSVDWPWNTAVACPMLTFALMKTSPPLKSSRLVRVLTVGHIDLYPAWPGNVIHTNSQTITSQHPQALVEVQSWDLSVSALECVNVFLLFCFWSTSSVSAVSIIIRRDDDEDDDEKYVLHSDSLLCFISGMRVCVSVCVRAQLLRNIPSLSPEVHVSLHSCSLFPQLMSCSA